MSICCEMHLVPAIVLNIEDKVDTHLLESWQWLAVFAKVAEGLVLINLAQFWCNRFLPMVVLGCVSKSLGIFPVMGHFMSALELWSMAE